MEEPPLILIALERILKRLIDTDAHMRNKIMQAMFPAMSDAIEDRTKQVVAKDAAKAIIWMLFPEVRRDMKD